MTASNQADLFITLKEAAALAGRSYAWAYERAFKTFETRRGRLILVRRRDVELEAQKARKQRCKPAAPKLRLAWVNPNF